MARIRSLKPEFWTDEAIAECSPSARLLFVATWTFADDKGNLDRSAKQLKAQAYPYDALDCEPLVAELLKQGLLIEYEVDGKKYLHIRNFDKHQKVDKESKPRFPLYDDSKTTPRALAEPSTSPRPSSLVSSSGVESSGGESKGGVRGDAAVAAVVLHASLPTKEWDEWIGLRRKKRWPLDELTLRKQLGLLKDFDTETQRQIIDASIRSTWQGLFAPKDAKRTEAPPRSWPKELHDQIVAAYHELLPDLPAVRDWPERRRTLLDCRIAERVKAGKAADNIGYWRGVFEKVQASDFLCGRKSGSDWRCPGLEWLLDDENFLGVIEGSYDNNPRINGAHHAR